MAPRAKKMAGEALWRAVEARCRELYVQRWGEIRGDELGALSYAAEIEAYDRGRPVETEAVRLWRHVETALKNCETFATRHRDGDGGFAADNVIDYARRGRELVTAIRESASSGVVSGHARPPTRASYIRDRLRVYESVSGMSATSFAPRDLAVFTLLAGFLPVPRSKATSYSVDEILSLETQRVRDALRSLRNSRRT